MTRKILPLEFGGIAFVLACSAFMRRFYEWNNHELLGILFGAVNGSIWENAKTLLLPYLLWGLIEVLAVRVSLYRFAVAKTAGLYLLGGLYLGLRLCGMHAGISAALSLAAAFAVSAALYYSDLYLRELFAPAVALLFLFVALYFSLTPFPPKHALFVDPETGMYGIIPDYLDYGAVVMSG